MYRKATRMAVIRGSLPADNFTMISNDWLRDTRLSWKAKGLLAYIASHAAGWALSAEQIVSQGNDGRDAVRAGLRELEEAGYLTRVQRRGDGGKIVSTDYLIGKPVAGKPVPGPDQGRQDVSAGETSDGFPTGGEPASKKTTSQKTKEKTNSSASPRRGTRVPEDFTPDDSMRAWYRENGIGHHIDGAAEHERFMDYWRAQPGQKGVKTDWPATWRNWMRRAAERPQRGRPATRGGYRTALERSADRLQDEADLARVAEAYLEATGGNPEDPAQVRPLLDELKRHPEGARKLLEKIRNPNGSAPRTGVPYSGVENVIDGEVAQGSREVTSYATERNEDAPR